ncbi:DUF1826 domain-containing protein [Dinoroseobacter sp. S76]|uniref:DUF1826 domain-containing protein n=1 Tax=Dinoroseobacter sp. S76 TaxID=3415124 RepID=UPI003C7DFB31
MTLAHSTPPRTDHPVVTLTETVEGLYAIREPRCGAAIWQRAPRPGFQDWIDGLDPAQLPRARLVLRPAAVAGALATLCDASGMPEGPARQWFEADVTALTTRFAALMRAEYLRLRLDVITTNACSKFHMDAILARLVCSYRGTGTQLGPTTDGTDPETVTTLAPCSPVVLRGALWPPQGEAHVLHRSPPIAGTGETRLVLVLDPVYDLEDA